MAKALLVAICIFLVNGCPFLPPSPYHRSIYGDYPPGYIATSPGQSVEGSVSENLHGSADIVSVSSELNGELLTAIFHLRELPEDAEYNRNPGHFRLETNRWLVLVSIDGDPLTPMSHLDYLIQAVYYDPKKTDIVFAKPTEPMVTGALYEFGRAIAEHNGIEFTSHTLLSDEIEVTFSQEDNTLTLATRVPGITGKSTIAFVAHGRGSISPDYLPRAQTE